MLSGRGRLETGTRSSSAGASDLSASRGGKGGGFWPFTRGCRVLVASESLPLVLLARMAQVVCQSARPNGVARQVWRCADLHPAAAVRICWWRGAAWKASSTAGVGAAAASMNSPVFWGLGGLVVGS
uniref:Uncharacterized protein n=1 Tax=Arundo donax TaxID=35708 RepID=A0A0A9EZV3_ARUDO